MQIFQSVDPTLAAIQSTTVNHHKTTNQPGTSFQTCNNCQKRFPHAGGRMTCPAWGKTCHQCGKLNHFANSCRSAAAISQNSAQQSKNPGNRTHRKSDIQYRPPSQTYTQHQPRRVRQIRDDVIDEPDDSDTDDLDGQIYSIGKRPRIKQPRVMLTVNNTKMAFIIDSGVRVSILWINIHFHNLIHRRDCQKPNLICTHTDPTRPFPFEAFFKPRSNRRINSLSPIYSSFPVIAGHYQVSNSIGSRNYSHEHQCHQSEYHHGRVDTKVSAAIHWNRKAEIASN